MARAYSSVSTSCISFFYTNVDFFSGYEEDDSSPENFYRTPDHRDDGYQPSPPHASRGGYYPDNNQFPPPPTASVPLHHPNESTPFVNEIPPIPPYNPQDYAGQRAANDPHPGYPSSPRPGDNVSFRQSSNPVPIPDVMPPPAPAGNFQESYFPAHELSPLETDHVYDRAGAS